MWSSLSLAGHGHRQRKTPRTALEDGFEQGACPRPVHRATWGEKIALSDGIGGLDGVETLQASDPSNCTREKHKRHAPTVADVPGMVPSFRALSPTVVSPGRRLRAWYDVRLRGIAQCQEQGVLWRAAVERARKPCSTAPRWKSPFRRHALWPALVEYPRRTLLDDQEPEKPLDVPCSTTESRQRGSREVLDDHESSSILGGCA